jgi:tetratricopeptide (TPR) repeat protein
LAPVNALCVLPDGRLVSGSDDKTIRLWDPASGTEIGRIEGHSDFVTALCVLPDGRLVSGSKDKTIQIWDVRRIGPSLGQADKRSPALEAFADISQTGGLAPSDEHLGEYLLPNLAALSERADVIDRLSHKNAVPRWSSLIRDPEGERSVRELLTKLQDTPSFDRCHALLLLGSLYSSTFKFAKAEETLQKAVNEVDRLTQRDGGIRDLSVMLKIGLGDALLMQSRYREAGTLYEKVEVEGDEGANSATLFTRVGAIALGQGDYSRAESLCLKAINRYNRLGPAEWGAVPSWCMLGIIYSILGRFDEAVNAFNRSGNLGPHGHVDTARSCFNLAVTLERLGAPDPVMSRYAAALAMAHPNDEALRSRAFRKLTELHASRPTD